MDAKFQLYFKVKINSFAGTTKCILGVFNYRLNETKNFTQLLECFQFLSKTLMKEALQIRLISGKI